MQVTWHKGPTRVGIGQRYVQSAVNPPRQNGLTIYIADKLELDGSELTVAVDALMVGIVSGMPEMEHIIPPRHIRHAAEWQDPAETVPDNIRWVCCRYLGTCDGAVGKFYFCNGRWDESRWARHGGGDLNVVSWIDFPPTA